jgi:beta-glucanase (GH16 family)
MRLLWSVVCLLAVLSANAHSQEWKLVWSDEFDYEGMPDATKWDYEEGFVRNQEMQYYTKQRPENARVEGGHLIIEGRKEKFKNSGHKPGSNTWISQREFAAYTSASLITRNKASWRYGRIEVRAKLPRGCGVWPAIWTLGVNRSTHRWPACGEIDIMEFVGKEPQHVHGNAHFSIAGEHRSKAGKLETDPPPFTDFHVYAIDWNKDQIEFYFDGTKYHTFAIDAAGSGTENPFRKPHYLLVNLAIGGSWGGEIDDAVLPQKYLIDYVRIYVPEATTVLR